MAEAFPVITLNYCDMSVSNAQKAPAVLFHYGPLGLTQVRVILVQICFLLACLQNYMMWRMKRSDYFKALIDREFHRNTGVL